MNILIIDDNEMTRSLLRTIVQAGGYKVIGEASNGESALQLALKVKPDLICLDILMPGSDGMDILSKILEELPKTIVLMVTGKHDADTVQSAVKKGAKGFIIKPFNTATVLNTIKSAASRK